MGGIGKEINGEHWDQFILKIETVMQTMRVQDDNSLCKELRKVQSADEINAFVKGGNNRNLE